jgi:NodT family efflux transporter outer membrane factor (OMF) lipoprotein
MSLAGIAFCIPLLQGCSVGPKYNAPAAQAPADFKELKADDFKDTDGWKVAQPADAALRSNWWEAFNDTELNQLEEQVNISNQNVAAATASFFQARAIVGQARSQYFPTVGTAPSITYSRLSPRSTTNASGTTASQAFQSPTYSLPFDATWVPDLFGRVKNTVRADIAAAQISAADLENTRLTAHAELAVDYFQLRTEDSLKQLLDSTVVAYRESLRLQNVLFETGIASDEAVAQAETQLETAEAEDTNLGILRGQDEHAIALLVGQPASSFAIQPAPLKPSPVAIPFGIPSKLLERRPDIAAAERGVAEANAQIGVARAAYFPNLTLGASVGLESTAIADWFTWPSRVFSVGPTLAETLFDGGLRRATVEQYRARYDQTVASYRETVLTAFQQVEDNLSTLRILSAEIQQQDRAVQAAARSLAISTDRYRLGIDPYLNVITAQTILLTNQQTAVNLRMQQMTASVQLIEALGGGWDLSQLPSDRAIVSNSPQAPKTNP